MNVNSLNLFFFDPNKPSFFELINQEKMDELIEPAIEYILSVIINKLLKIHISIFLSSLNLD